MYSSGVEVFHDQYGWGSFLEVTGRSPRVAAVEFKNRGIRFFALPSSNLKTVKQRWAELSAAKNVSEV